MNAERYSIESLWRLVKEDDIELDVLTTVYQLKSRETRHQKRVQEIARAHQILAAIQRVHGHLIKRW